MKKRHHFVPVAYLTGFTADDGFLHAFRKDQPEKPLRSRPEAIGFIRHYYSQLNDAGELDQRLEDGLAELESDWPALAAKASSRSDLSPDDMGYLLDFMALQRLRVPAARDLAEKALAHRVMSDLRRLDAMGELPPKPDGLDNLLDRIQVTIDPQKSLEAMTKMFPHVSGLFDTIGYEIVHDATGVGFITSDNPVVYFDPSGPERDLVPYRVRVPQRPAELLFPIDKGTLLRGHSKFKERYSRRGPRHVSLRDPGGVRRVNRLVARFGYEMIIMSDLRHAGLARAYAASSPILREVKASDGTVRLEAAFGPRRPKPKWRPPSG